MKAILVAFDSLNRKYLPPYGNDWVQAPNFQRLANRTLTFDRSYVCSMPCMPARRDLQTGRPNFLHRPWGPMEPWDDSLPEILKKAGVSPHIVTDHYHYLEDGGATYHTRYETWQCFRGQEGDPWIGQVAEPSIPPNINGKGRRQDWVNRQFLRDEKDWPQVQTFDAGLDFIARNHDEDNWFLQIETFDPHEPFTAPDGYNRRYESAGGEPIFDWPDYADVTETPEEVERARHNYAALVSLCDAQLGRVLDAMDEKDLWKDTMLIVWTDHGFLLGEHNRWAKNVPRMWEEISHTPFFMWSPRCGAAGERRSALVQPSLDLAPTLLRHFGIDPTPDMTGYDLAPVCAEDKPVREIAVFGHHGMPIHATDGRFVYMRQQTDPELPCGVYTWMPTRMRGFWKPEELQRVRGFETLPFSKGIPVPCFEQPRKPGAADAEPEPHLLFDLENDPDQEAPVHSPEEEDRIIELMRSELQRVHAPTEYAARYDMKL